MILSDRDIQGAMARLENPLIIDPPFHKDRLQPASLELTLADEILVSVKGSQELVLTSFTELHETWDHGPWGYLNPGDFWLATTIETVQIPTDLVAQVNGKSSHARRGLVVHQTAGFIDPGFKGQVTLELSNASMNGIRLTRGMAICQLVFMQMTSPAERPYGSTGLGSHYQGQRGPTPSRG